MSSPLPAEGYLPDIPSLQTTPRATPQPRFSGALESWDLDVIIMGGLLVGIFSFSAASLSVSVPSQLKPTEQPSILGDLTSPTQPIRSSARDPGTNFFMFRPVAPSLARLCPRLGLAGGAASRPLLRPRPAPAPALLPSLPRSFSSPRAPFSSMSVPFEPAYVFPRDKLKTPSGKKTPLILLACGSYSPVTFMHLRLHGTSLLFYECYLQLSVRGKRKLPNRFLLRLDPAPSLSFPLPCT